ncbi:MAG: class I SAM-dependent methyltransferase [Chloroflexaceae bacterium]
MSDIYAGYAPIYDAIGQGAFAEALARRLLAALPAPPERVLDLACGTGAATLVFAAHGAATVGVDRSAAMLAIARARACDLPITWLAADIRRLPVGQLLAPASFDLITCLYDSLNYLTATSDLALAIGNAAHLLRPGGRLIFDLNTEHEFATWGEGLDQVVYDADGLLVYHRLAYDATARLAYGRVVWFVWKDGRWRRGQEQHVERAWSDAEVLDALAGAGLRLIARRAPSWEPAPADAPRVVYEAMRVP